MQMMEKNKNNEKVGIDLDMDMDMDMEDVMSNSDYFFARGVAQGLGAGPLASVFAAVIPSTMAKITSRRQQDVTKRLEEQLEEEEEKLRR